MHTIMTNHDITFVWNTAEASKLIRQFQKAARNTDLSDTTRAYADAFETNILILGGGMEMNAKAMQHFICIVTNAESDLKAEATTAITFYWKPKDGFAIHDKLKDASKNDIISEEARYTAKVLVSQSEPSSLGYSLIMDSFFMEQFIKIITQ